MNHEKALEAAWTAFNRKDGSDHTALARAISVYLSAIVSDEVAGVVKGLRFRATAKGDADLRAGRKPPEYGPQAEIEWRAADLLTALAARAEKAERERDEARKERDENFADAKRASSEYHALGEENLANHRKVRTLEAELSRVNRLLQTSVDEFAVLRDTSATEIAALRARLEEAGNVTRECADLLTDLDLGRSIHNGRFPENKIDGPLWAQIGRVTSNARRWKEEAK